MSVGCWRIIFKWYCCYCCCCCEARALISRSRIKRSASCVVSAFDYFSVNRYWSLITCWLVTQSDHVTGPFDPSSRETWRSFVRDHLQQQIGSGTWGQSAPFCGKTSINGCACTGYVHTDRVYVSSRDGAHTRLCACRGMRTCSWMWMRQRKEAAASRARQYVHARSSDVFWSRGCFQHVWIRDGLSSEDPCVVGCVHMCVRVHLRDLQWDQRSAGDHLTCAGVICMSSKPHRGPAVNHDVL